jgi:hypothetical protein
MEEQIGRSEGTGNFSGESLEQMQFNCEKKQSKWADQTMLIKFSCLLFVLVALFLNGCGTAAPIQKYSESKSHFSKNPPLIDTNIPENDLYRIYHRAASGFVSIEAIRETAEKRATEFCEERGKAMKVVGEQISNPPYILGNFPRIEIIFACVDKPKNDQPAFEDTEYIKLTNLKKLLDSGAITEKEFEQEKSKILDK